MVEERSRTHALYKFLLSVFDVHVNIICYVKCTNKKEQLLLLAISWTTRRIHLYTCVVLFFQLLLQCLLYITAESLVEEVPDLSDMGMHALVKHMHHCIEEGMLLDCQPYIEHSN